MSDEPQEAPRRARPAQTRAEREARTAAALRANLRRRKSQARARDAGEASPPSPAEMPEGD